MLDPVPNRQAERLVPYPIVLARSAPRGALSVDVAGVERLARGHEEPVPPEPAEAEIRAALGKQDAQDHLPLGREDGHPVMALTPAPAAPEIALGVAAKPVGNPGPAVDEETPVR